MAFKPTLSALATIVAISLPSAGYSDGHLSADTVVATINGKDVTLGHMIVLRQRLPQQYQQLPGDVLFEGILDQLIQQTLLSEQTDTLPPSAKLALENEERAQLANQEINRVIEGAATDEALEVAYNDAYGSADPETEFNASHILVETEEEAMVLVDMLNGGGDFAELAKEKSTGPSGPGGGSLGWFGAGAMVPAFEEAVMALDVGDVSAPVQTQFGWHVITLNETRIKSAPALEEVRPQLLETVQREALEARLAELEGSAEVTRMTAEEIDPAILNDVSLIGE